MDIPVKRRSEIQKLINERGSMTVKEIAEILNFSSVTIFRDLKYLQNKGLIEKVHGGAIIKKSDNEYNPEYSEDIKRFTEEKKRIALEAASLEELLVAFLNEIIFYT